MRSDCVAENANGYFPDSNVFWGKVGTLLAIGMPRMNTANAFGFFLFGLVLAMLPLVAPTYFPPTGFDGTSTRALWLHVVGSAQVIIGVVWLGQVVSGKLADQLATFEMPVLDGSPAVTVEHARKQLV